MKNNGPWLAALALAAAMPVAADDWTAWITLDRLTGDETVVGVYTAARPDEPRPSLYADIEGLLIISCDSGVAYFRLSDSEGSIVEFLPHGTADWIEIPIRFDNETVQELDTYTYGERYLLAFGNTDTDMLSLAEGRRRLRIKVPSDKGFLYFDFGLTGFTGLHEAYRETCG